MPPSHVERLHILSLQLDGTHGASLSTFYVRLFQEAPCVFQVRASAIKYSQHSHVPSWRNVFFAPVDQAWVYPLCCPCEQETFIITELWMAEHRARAMRMNLAATTCLEQHHVL